METQLSKKTAYIESTLAFYFNGKFESNFHSLGSDETSLNGWANMASLFQLVSNDIANEHRYNLFTLVEDLYTAVEVDLMFGEKIEGIELEDILDGHGEDMSYLFEQ
ncbi:hypothetical protein D1Z90_02790 [Motilimonas pumila]|uniref:Uncharacterized protein n=1 Tax=Motilimonas pumila TaxID=2303987 RepID=A0A418YIT7_9GAMM|nr:hypothetical protein D1Z90_02790 [Motilimonas pumila]